MSFSKKEKRAILLAVISGIIIFFFKEIWTNLEALINWLLDILICIKKFLLEDSHLPVIGLIILSLTSLPVFIKILGFILKPFKKKETEKEEQQISFLDYKKGNYEGINWQWEWQDNHLTGKHDIKNLRPYCPS